MAASRNGRRSLTVSIGEQASPKVRAHVFDELRHVYTLATCAALAGG